MKKKLLLVIGITLLLLVGCEDNTKETIISNNEKVDVSKMQHKECSRIASAKEGMDTSFIYNIYYTGDILNIIQSEEKVTTENQEDLDLYEESYKKIKANYEGLKYYDIEVNRTSNSVGISINVNYDKVDIGKILDIEGEEDNIFENGKAKVDKWMELAKKFGAKCSEVLES